MYLFIDTATRYGAVGLWRTEDATFVRVGAWWSRHNHTAELMPAIETAMAGAGVTPSDLRGAGVITGPGGFSALRAGMGVAKGLAFALSIPLVGVSALEAEAYAHRDAGWPVCAVMEAGRDAVAWARFQQTPEGWRRRTPDRVTPLDGLLAARGRHTLFCGEGIGVRAEQLREALGARAHVVSEPMPLSRLQGMAALASARLDEGEGDSVAALEPRYLRPPGITKPNPAKAARQRRRESTPR